MTGPVVAWWNRIIFDWLRTDPAHFGARLDGGGIVVLGNFAFTQRHARRCFSDGLNSLNSPLVPAIRRLSVSAIAATPTASATSFASVSAAISLASSSGLSCGLSRHCLSCELSN